MIEEAETKGEKRLLARMVRQAKAIAVLVDRLEPTTPEPDWWPDRAKYGVWRGKSDWFEYVESLKSPRAMKRTFSNWGSVDIIHTMGYAIYDLRERATALHRVLGHTEST